MKAIMLGFGGGILVMFGADPASFGLAAIGALCVYTAGHLDGLARGASS
jgi:hypothetical protein